MALLFDEPVVREVRNDSATNDHDEKNKERNRDSNRVIRKTMNKHFDMKPYIRRSKQ